MLKSRKKAKSHSLLLYFASFPLFKERMNPRMGYMTQMGLALRAEPGERASLARACCLEHAPVGSTAVSNANE